MTYREVADATVLSVRTIQRAVDAGQLAVIRFGHRTVRITEADVSKWVMTKRSGGTQ
jgi:excisionase family DNA binding protein